MSYLNYHARRYEYTSDYDNLDPANVRYLENCALARDDRLNSEELAIKEETERVCILGPEYWLRAHP